VNDTEPIFFYCSAPGACLKDGMIGVINPTPTKDLQTQQEFAKNATLMFNPGIISPAEIVPASSPTASSAITTTTITPDPTASATSVSKTTSSSSPILSPGAIAGIAIGGTAVLIVAVTLLYLCGRQRAKGEWLQAGIYPPTQYLPGPVSMISNTTKRSPKHPYNCTDSLAREEYVKSPIETATWRSRSPPFEYEEYRNRDLSMEPMDLSPSPISIVPEMSPLSRRPMAESLGVPSPTSTLNPMGETFYQPLHIEVPTPLR
jgi:hypothetical protein